MLKPGDQCPDFVGEASYPGGDIQPFDLDSTRGRWLTLFFWPMDFTFVCPTEVKGYAALQGEFQRLDCALVGASIDSAYVHQAWREQRLGEVGFPMVGDVTRRLCSRFGVLTADGVALRATFIIDPEGVIQSVMANGLNVGRSVRETVRLVEAFQSGELTACEWQPGNEFVKAA